HWTALERYAGTDGRPAASLLESRLETGRTHQIRVHLAAAGHPLLGDPLYGRASEKRLSGLSEGARAALAALPGQALQACRLGFRHPASGRRLSFEQDYPQEIRDLIATLESL
ncbi:MAG: RNA pseudouridine synthase, partial [Kiloniellales bacterium]